MKAVLMHLFTLLVIWSVDCVVPWNERCSFVELSLLVVIPRNHLASRSSTVLVKCILCSFIKRSLYALYVLAGLHRTSLLQLGASLHLHSWDKKYMFCHTLRSVAYHTAIAHARVRVQAPDSHATRTYSFNNSNHVHNNEKLRRERLPASIEQAMPLAT